MIIYTDGSCHGNPGKGGWALYCPETGYEDSGFSTKTTNNRMELTAIMEAMKLQGVKTIITDSRYCHDGCTKWVQGWARKNWKTSTGTDVKNIDLWKNIFSMLHKKIEFKWVRAHDTNDHNIHVDKLANNAINMQGVTTDQSRREYLVTMATTLKAQLTKIEEEIVQIDSKCK